MSVNYSAQVSHGGENYDSTAGTAETDAEAIEKAKAWGMTVPCDREKTSLMIKIGDKPPQRIPWW